MNKAPMERPARTRAAAWENRVGSGGKKRETEEVMSRWEGETRNGYCAESVS